jgi:hypothetical protein
VDETTMEHWNKRPVAWAKEHIRSQLRTALFCLKSPNYEL